jgi:hypothetical protein
MPDLTTAEELRAAADRLKWLLHPDGMPEQIRTGWTQQPFPAQQGVITVPGEDVPVAMAYWGGVTEYVVAMQPTVGEGLAKWLATEADVLDELLAADPLWRPHPALYQPLNIARAILASSGEA